MFRATGLLGLMLAWFVLYWPALAQQPALRDTDPLYAGSTETQRGYIPLATAEPLVLPPLSAYGSGGCLKPRLTCPGPCAQFCTPPLYYGTNPLDDDWTNPLLGCAGGKCGESWYRYARASIHCHDGFARAVRRACPDKQ